MADIVIVFFSRDSCASRWPRAQWEDALVKEPDAEGVHIAFLRCDDCDPAEGPDAAIRCEAVSSTEALGPQPRPNRGPPQLRARQTTFAVLTAARTSRSSASPSPIAPESRPCDEPRSPSNSSAAYREDFDGILYLDCGGRSLAALTGDLAAQLGMRLEGPVQHNLERLREFCSERRFLLVLDDVWESRPTR